MRRLTYLQKQKALKTIRAAHKNTDAKILLRATLTDSKTSATNATAENLKITNMAEWFALYFYNHGKRTI